MNDAQSLPSTPAARRAFVVVMLIGSALITWSSLVYFDADDLAPFVLEKLEVVTNEALFTNVLRLHVAAAAFAFPACLALMSRTVLRRLPRVHRWLGRTAGLVLLGALVPSGAVLSIWAKGGAISTAGFLLSGAIVFVAMLRAIASARARDFVLHRKCVLHVVAQLSVAVTSRALLVGADLLGFDHDTAYVVVLWVPVIASAIIVEEIVRTRARAAPRRTREIVAVPVPARLLDPVRVRDARRPAVS